MNSCDYFQELISRSIDEELTAEERKVLARHLESCEECALMSAAFSGISECISEDIKEAPETLAVNVMAQIRRAEIIKKNRRKRGIRTALASVACLALVIVAASSLPMGKRAESFKAAAPEAPAFPAAAPEAAAAEQAQFSLARGEAEAAPAATVEEAAEDCAPAEATELFSDSAAAGAGDSPVMIELSAADWAELQQFFTGEAAELPEESFARQTYLLKCSEEACCAELLVYGNEVYYTFEPLSGEYCVSAHEIADFETFFNR